VTLVLENRLDLLVVMPTGHGKSAAFMIPPMVTGHTIIVVVPLSILVSGHEADASRASLRYATYGTDTIMFDDPSSILYCMDLSKSIFFHLNVINLLCSINLLIY
jgi:superfamily II DNA helicase RecQ